MLQEQNLLNIQKEISWLSICNLDNLNQKMSGSFKWFSMSAGILNFSYNLHSSSIFCNKPSFNYVKRDNKLKREKIIIFLYIFWGDIITSGSINFKVFIDWS